jgi:hypothetical protein
MKRSFIPILLTAFVLGSVMAAQPARAAKKELPGKYTRKEKKHKKEKREGKSGKEMKLGKK